MTYDPFEDCEDCATFDPTDPLEVDTYIDDPYTDCGGGNNPFGASSKIYPIFFDDSSATGSTEITEGTFRALVRSYSYGLESTNTLTQELTEGVFRQAIHDYSYQESTNITDRELTEGVFRQVIHDYSYGPESTDITARELTEGVFRDALIEYVNGLAESSNITAAEIIGGTHDTP